MIPTNETATRGVINTNVFEVTQKVMELATLAGHPEDTQNVLNILFGVNAGKMPLSEELIQEALLYTWEHWYAANDRYATADTPLEIYLKKFKQQ